MNNIETFHQVKAAVAFDVLRELAHGAKQVLRHLTAISNLIAIAATQGLEVRVIVDNDPSLSLTPHSKSRQVIISDRNGRTVAMIVTLWSFKHRSLTVRGNAYYGMGDKGRELKSVDDAITALRGITNKW